MLRFIWTFLMKLMGGFHFFKDQKHQEWLKLRSPSSTYVIVLYCFTWRFNLGYVDSNQGYDPYKWVICPQILGL